LQELDNRIESGFPGQGKKTRPQVVVETMQRDALVQFTMFSARW
jgi:hypothetical protein